MTLTDGVDFDKIKVMKKFKAPVMFAIVASVTVYFSGCKKPVSETESGTGGKNHPPVITEVNVSPSPVSVVSPIKLSVRANDPDGDRVEIKYRWIVNGEEVAEGGDTLSEGKFTRGDRITVSLIPSDGKTDGEPYTVDIDVVNLAPVVEEIQFSPEVPVSTQPLKVNALARDPEGDSVELKYAWFVDDSLVEAENSNTLLPKYFKKGSRVVVEVIPSDGETTGKSLISQSITIGNSPPKITSSPPTSVSGNRYNYRVIANDPDGDAITFSLENAPEGMTIDSKSGALNWQLAPESKGEYTFSIIAEDTDGARAIQTVTLSF